MGKVIDDVLGGRRGQQGGRVSLAAGAGGQGKRTSLRTIVKGRYRTLGAKGPNPARGRASAVMRNMDYAATRPDFSHQRVSRDVITPERVINIQDSPADRRLLEDELTGAKEKYIYHLVLSSGDRSMSPKDVELWAKAVLQSREIGKYHMVIHAGEQGHTKNPHVHVIVRSDVRFGRDEFFNMRRSGDVEQQLHRQLFRELEEAWRERFPDKAAAGGIQQPEHDEEERGKKRNFDIQFE